MFIHLHGHSHYSLLKAIGEPSKIVKRAKKLNMSAIALTDYENLYGAIEFYEECTKNDIKPIIGTEINFTLNYNNLAFSKKIETNYITLLAKSFNGYKNILKIISFSQTKGLYKNIPYIDINVLKNFSDDIFIILGGINSRIGKLIKSNKDLNLIKEYLEKLVNALGKENILIEIQPQNLEIYKKLNKNLYKLANKLNLLYIVNNNFHYISKEYKNALGLLQAIDQNEFYNPTKHNPKEERHIMDEDEIKQLLTKYEYLSSNIISNNKTIAENINIHIPLGQILLPKYKVKKNRQKIYNQYIHELTERS